MSIRSEEVNYLIYRYLQECGFEHSAFIFLHESMLADTKVCDENVEPGALIVLLKKALQYMELEAHVRDDGSEVECVAPFSLIHPHKCISGKREPKEDDLMEEETSTKEFLPTKVKALEGHSNKIFSCKWSPQSDILATGSADSTVHMWSVTPLEESASPSFESTVGPVLSHTCEEGSNDITSIDWSNNGEKLVTASYNGEVKIWSNSGELQTTVCSLQHPVLNVSFSPNNSKLLISGILPAFYIYGLDNNMPTQELDTITINEREKKAGRDVIIPANSIFLDSIWRDDSLFTLVDNENKIINIHLNPNSDQNPVQILTGHDSDINSICWTIDGRALISGGDDHVIKLWNEEKNDPVLEFTPHNDEVNQVLASKINASHFFSCSSDKTVKVFDINKVTAITTFSNHDAAVTHIAQSNGDYSKIIASTGRDKFVYLYDTSSNEMIRSYKANNYVYDLAFNRSGDILSLATRDSQVYLLDIRA